MYDDASIDVTDSDLAPGWGEEDVRLLDELAQLGMRLARALVDEVEADAAGGTEAKSPPAAARAALDFSRISRAVRLSLSLKAQARGAPMPGSRPARASDDSGDDGAHADPRLHPRVVGACIKERADEIRRDLRHALTNPERDAAERERLYAEVEQRLERESEHPEKFLWGSPWQITERIAQDLGLGIDIRIEQTAAGKFRGWVIARPGDPTCIVLPDDFDHPKPTPPQPQDPPP